MYLLLIPFSFFAVTFSKKTLNVCTISENTHVCLHSSIINLTLCAATVNFKLFRLCCSKMNACKYVKNNKHDINLTTLKSRDKGCSEGGYTLKNVDIQPFPSTVSVPKPGIEPGSSIPTWLIAIATSRLNQLRLSARLKIFTIRPTQLW